MAIYKGSFPIEFTGGLFKEDIQNNLIFLGNTLIYGSGSIVPPAPVFNFLLDEVPTAAVGFSLRKLRVGYTGDCIEVRRSNDNALQNIGFVDNVLDTASLLTFVGANNGFVKTWYDQSGNGRNATQTSNNDLQPQIVSSGTVIVENTKPTISFISPAAGNSGQGGLDFSTFSATAVEGYVVVKAKNDPATTEKNSGFIIIGTNADGSIPHFPYTDGNIYDSFGTSARKTVGNPATTLAQLNLYNPLSISGTWSVRLNATEIFTVANNTVLINTNPKIGGTDTRYGLNAFVSELVIYPANKTSDRGTVETNINSFYTLY